MVFTNLDSQRKYQFNFNFQALPTDKITTLEGPYLDKKIPGGIAITRKGATLSLRFFSEDILREVYGPQPDVVLLGVLPISSKPISRIDTHTNEPKKYDYLSDYHTTGCENLNGTAQGCGMSFFSKVNSAPTVGIECQASAQTVTSCDEVLKTVQMEVTEL